MLYFWGCKKDTLKIHFRKFYQNWSIVFWEIKSWTLPINSLIEKDIRNFRKGWLGQFYFWKHFFSAWRPNLTTNGWNATEIFKKVKITAPYCTANIGVAGRGRWRASRSQTETPAADDCGPKWPDEDLNTSIPSKCLLGTYWLLPQLARQLLAEIDELVTLSRSSHGVNSGSKKNYFWADFYYFWWN